MSETSTRANRISGTALLVVLVAVAGMGTLAWAGLRRQLSDLERELAALGDSTDRLARAVQLYRLEQTSKEGLGITALIEQLRFWGPRLDDASTPAPERPAIRARLEAALHALAALDAQEAAARLEGELAAAESEQVQPWLLRALVRVAPRRGAERLTRMLRGLDDVSMRLRLFAADELATLDREQAGRVLRDLLDAEIDPGSSSPVNDRLHLFIDRYVSTGDPEAERVLTGILQHAHDHHPLTVQEAVKALGDMRAEAARDEIRELFESPPRNTHPMFRNHCLDALAAIDGAAAADYFREALREEENELVRTKLQDLVDRIGG